MEEDSPYCSPMATPPSTPPPVARSARRLSSFHTVRRQSFAHRPSQTPLRPKTPNAHGLRPSPGADRADNTPAKTPRRTSLAAKPAPRMSGQALAEMYSTTIKLCNDNKINVKNTWSLNLIDYMGMLVKEANADDTDDNRQSSPRAGTPVLDKAGTGGDTSFQIAGATLDAGVRIYCSRVDSVHTNAFKVLGALSRTANPAAHENSAEDGEGDGSSADEADADSTGAKRKTRAARRAGGSTLETKLENITTRKLETDLVIDPLFRKMSAAFDEGGAKGMLLNNLCVNANYEIVFDSSEPIQMTRGTTADRTPQTPADKRDIEIGQDTCIESVSQGADDTEERPSSSDSLTVDISASLPNANVDQSSLHLCPQFMRFYHSRVGGDSSSMEAETEHSGLSRNSSGESAYAVTQFDDTPDFDYDDTDSQMGGSFGGAGFLPSMVETSQCSTGLGTEASEMSAGLEDDDDVVGPFEAGRASTASNLSHVSSITSAAVLRSGGVDLIDAGLALQSNSEYSFFDASALQGWSGPLHWRFRANAVLCNKGPAAGGIAGGKRRKGKTAMLLDFSADAPDMDFAAEFRPSRSVASVQLSEAVRDGFSEKKVTLPEDLHYSTATLATLFLKPKVAIVAKRRRHGVSSDGRIEGTEGGATNGWYDFDNEGDNGSLCGADNGSDVMFAFDGEDGEDIADGDGTKRTDLVPEPRRVEKVDIGFATVAKKVDVHQLKSGIWSHMCQQMDTESAKENRIEVDNIPSGRDSAGSKLSNAGLDNGVQGQSLQALVARIPEYVPENAVADVSLPYVFICLLHLANEKTLEINPASDGSLTDLRISSSTR